MKKSLLIFALFFLFFPGFSQTFTALNSGTGNQLNGTRFLSGNKGIVVGDGGKILMTTNGLNWSHKISGVPTDLKDVEYINPTTIIVVGDGGTILKSTNGGMGWTPINSGTPEMFYSLCVNGTDVYACGQNGVILKSTDEGDSWTDVSPGTGGHVFEMFFTSPTTGYAVGTQAYIHKTTNGGASWTTTYDYDSGISEDFQLRSIYFTDANNGYIVGKNSFANQAILVRTTNGGATWIPQVVLGTHYVDIKFSSSDIGYIISQNETWNTSAIFRTIDGGANWTLQSSIPKAQTDIAFPSANVGYTCGLNGTIFKSININLGIEDFESDQALSVYPNPSTGKITISFDSSVPAKDLITELYSASGERLILQSNTGSLDISNIPSGVYLLKVQNETSFWTKKVIKE